LSVRIYAFRATLIPQLLVMVGLVMTFSPIWWPLKIFGFSLMLGFFFDTIARHRDFWEARSAILRGKSEAVAKLLAVRAWTNSHCCRRALYFSALSVGKEHARMVRDAIRARGYRWWHILPDNTFSRLSPWLRWNFYARTLGFRRKRSLK